MKPRTRFPTPQPDGRRKKWAEWGNELPEVAAHLIKAGLKQEDLAIALGVTPDRITVWKRAHPEFERSINQAIDDVRTGQIEGTLFQRAMGYPYEEEDIRYQRLLVPTLDGDGRPVLDEHGNSIQHYEMIMVDRTVKKKHQAPSVASIIYWLWNRASDRWKKEQPFEVKENDQFKALMEVLRAGPAKVSKAQVIQGLNLDKEDLKP